MEKEYDNLRNEIIQKIELINTLLTFTITTTVAILTFALSRKNEILYLMPFCIIIPMSIRIAYYRSTISKLSAYMIVFLEKNLDGINWETRNALLVIENSNNKKRTFNVPTVLMHYDCMLLSVICYICYFVEYIKSRDINLQTACILCLPFLLVIWEIQISNRINSLAKEKQEWIHRWEILNEEKILDTPH